MDQDDRDQPTPPARPDGDRDPASRADGVVPGSVDDDLDDLAAAYAAPRPSQPEVPAEVRFASLIDPASGGGRRRVPAPSFAAAPSRGPFRDWTGKDVARAVAVVVAAAVFLLPVTLLLTKSREDAAAAAQQADGYSAPSLDLASGKRYTGPVVAVVGDESALRSASEVGRSGRWPALIAASLDSAVDVISVDNGGYATTGTDGVTFLNAASDLPADADVVLFVGGSNDVNASSAALGRAATNAMSAAAERAPGSSVAMVGPLITDGLSAARIAAVQAVLRSSASTAGVQWIDPTAARWLPTARAKGTDLTAADERAIAKRMDALVRRLAD